MQASAAEKITVSDRVLEKTILRLFPQSVEPNQVTLFRFLTIPFIAWFLLRGDMEAGAILFAIAAISDAIDGALARTRSQITDWGKLYDPLADKFLISITALILIPSHLDVTLAALIVGTEMFIVIGALIHSKTHHGETIQAGKVGKVKMILQSVGLTVLFAYVLFPYPVLLSLAAYTLYGAVAFAFLSLFVYRSI